MFKGWSVVSRSTIFNQSAATIAPKRLQPKTGG